MRERVTVSQILVLVSLHARKSTTFPKMIEIVKIDGIDVVVTSVDGDEQCHLTEITDAQIVGVPLLDTYEVCLLCRAIGSNH